MRKSIVMLLAAGVTGVALAKDRIAIVPAHPDDLIACLGFAHLARDQFELHVIDYTHGERGCGDCLFRIAIALSKGEGSRISGSTLMD